MKQESKRHSHLYMEEEKTPNEKKIAAPELENKNMRVDFYRLLSH